MNRPRSDDESIFLAALEHADPARRAAFVASACGDDRHLRRRVEDRLGSHDAKREATGPPAPPANHPADGSTEHEGPRTPASTARSLSSYASGDEAGVSLRPHADAAETVFLGSQAEVTDRPRPVTVRYEFLGEIARGGMGAILKGRDAALNRDLAFKILRDDLCDDDAMVRRFLEEAQIGGQLQHPGIVPIHDLGTLADRRPFFAMKLVKGRTLGELLKERAGPVGGGSVPRPGPADPASPGQVGPDGPDGGTDTGTRPADDLPRFLSIFEAVCQTVAYAHARGVIHRDLKPSNVMVGPFGEVLVMDWGLAKVLARSGGGTPADRPPAYRTVIATPRDDSVDSDLTGAGSVLGTPSYMAPEQARGEIERVDERADVFALGSILCEILTGKPTFLGRNIREIHGGAALADVSDAWARLGACGADLELIAIARDCLAPEPEDRPDHAGAVADRITAYLGGVQDRLRATEVARAAEEARAAEAIHTAAAADERARFERRARRFQVGLAACLLLLTTSGGLTFTYLLHLSHLRAARFERLLSETRTLHERARHQPGDPGPWREALAALEQADGQGPEAPIEALRVEIRAGLDAAERAAHDAGRDARLRHDVVEIRAGRADVGADGTDAAYTAAFRTADLDLDALEPTEFARRLRSRSESAAVELSAFLDDWSSARRAARRPVAAWRRPLEAARLADPEPYRDRLRLVLEAEDRRATAELLKALAADPEAAGLPAATAALLGRTLAGLGQYEAAVALLRPAAVRHPGDIWVNYVLAEALDHLNPPAREDAVRYFTAARALRPGTAHELAHLLERMKRDAEAEVLFRDLAERQPDNPRHPGCLGMNLQRLGRAAEAAPFLERAAAGFRKAIELHPDVAGLHYQLGNVLRYEKEPDRAAAEYRIAIRLNPEYAEAHCNLGMVLRALGDYAGSLAMLRRGHELGRKQPAWHYPSAQWVADAERLVKRPASRKAPDRGKAVAGRQSLAQMYSDIGRHAAAAAFWTEVLAADPELGDDRKAQVRYHAACSAALAATGRGTDEPKPDAAARDKLRTRALAWLQAERDTWAEVLESGDAPARSAARQSLARWKSAPDLAGIRDPDALAKLAEAERDAWRSLWAEVDRLLGTELAAPPAPPARGADKDGIGDPP